MELDVSNFTPALFPMNGISQKKYKTKALIKSMHIFFIA